MNLRDASINDEIEESDRRILRMGPDGKGMT
jgi:hypothetical protein